MIEGMRVAVVITANIANPVLDQLRLARLAD
jgi:hypothetical protein